MSRRDLMANAGYLLSHRHPLGGWLVVYNAVEAAMDDHQGSCRWVVIWEAVPAGALDGFEFSSSLGPGFPSMAAARRFVQDERAEPCRQWEWE